MADEKISQYRRLADYAQAQIDNLKYIHGVNNGRFVPSWVRDDIAIAEVQRDRYLSQIKTLEVVQ